MGTCEKRRERARDREREKERERERELRINSHVVDRVFKAPSARGCGADECHVATQQQQVTLSAPTPSSPSPSLSPSLYMCVYLIGYSFLVLTSIPHPMSCHIASRRLIRHTITSRIFRAFTTMRTSLCTPSERTRCALLTSSYSTFSKRVLYKRHFAGDLSDDASLIVHQRDHQLHRVLEHLLL
jgi:hypothetical protein